MEILTGAQMRHVDARAIRERGVPSLDLMENAGRAVAEAAAEEIPRLSRRPIVVVCGKGNNGGDGYVAARYLARMGCRPRVVTLAGDGSLSPDAAVQRVRAAEAGLEIEDVRDEPGWSEVVAGIGEGSIVIDALLGTGLKGSARGLVARAIEDLNAAPGTRLAVDVPSGADADSGRLLGPTLIAHRTYTLCRPKACLVLEPSASHAGSWRAVDIGIPDDLVADEASALSWFDREEAAALLPPRPRRAHKGSMGHLLAVAGARGKSGAALLLGRAALRSGVGLVTVATPKSAQPLVAGGQAELMTEALPEAASGTLAAGAGRAALGLLAARDALAAGPGLGTSPAARAALRALIGRRGAPAVLDADGLNAFPAARGRATALRAGRHPLVVTPHPGEAARLLGCAIAEVEADRPAAALALARTTGAVVVLKGWRTIVARPDGALSWNASGNPGMATGGTGDALTGVVGALLARGLPAFDAARLGTYVHGAAGDRAAASLGEDGMIAGDLIDELPAVFRELVEERRGVDGWTRGG